MDAGEYYDDLIKACKGWMRVSTTTTSSKRARDGCGVQGMDEGEYYDDLIKACKGWMRVSTAASSKRARDGCG
eukprot:358883-Chlamydomonas_euryale.AAC.5